MLASGGLFSVLAVAGLAWGFARVFRAPARVQKAIPLAALGFVVAAIVLLPSGHPFRDSLLASARAALFLGIVAVPIGAYALTIRRLRRRTGADSAFRGTSRRTGLVMIPEDAALVAERGRGVQRFSVAWRDRQGEVTASIHVRLRGPVAALELTGDEDELPRLLTEAVAEARRRGAHDLLAEDLPLLAEAGFARVALPGGAVLRARAL